MHFNPSSAWLRFVATLLIATSLLQAPARAEKAWSTGDMAVENRLLNDVKHLSSDALEGRGLSTKGLVVASESIAEAFAQAGLNTKAVGGSPYFLFDTKTWLDVGDDNSMRLSGQGVPINWTVHNQYRPLSLGISGDVDFPLAFAGYSITAPKNNYDDYADIDVKGKAVIVLRREPQQKDEDSPFSGTKNSEHAYLVRKVQNAANHNAAMMILVNDAESIEVDGKPDDLIPFQVKARLATRPFPVIHVTRKSLEPIFGKGELTKIEARIDEGLKPHSRLLPGWSINGKVSLTRRGNRLRNVIGVLEPLTGPAEETIIVGAHYDHLGRGGSGSLAPWTSDIHNGADDNGSGTAVLMEVARQVAMRRGELKRRVVFMAFSAEEAGLIGSARYVRAPVYPLESTAAMVNLDMVGRLGKQLIVYGTGTGNRFESMVDTHAETRSLKLKKIASGSGPSDHASFNRAGVPVLHLFTGLHSDYHRPSDDYDKLNIEGMRRITGMTVDIVMELATSTAPTRRPKKTLFGRETPPPGATTLGVGIVDVEGGCRVTAVAKDGPAEAAGIRIDDVLLSIGGAEIKDVKNLRDEITRRKASDTVKLKIRRGELTLEVEAKLQKAK